MVSSVGSPGSFTGICQVMVAYLMVDDERIIS